MSIVELKEKMLLEKFETYKGVLSVICVMQMLA